MPVCGNKIRQTDIQMKSPAKFLQCAIAEEREYPTPVNIPSYQNECKNSLQIYPLSGLEMHPV